MKVLYITAEGFDTPNPNNQMAEVIIRDLLDAGHQVHLVQSHRKGVNSDIPIRLLNRSGFTWNVVKRNVVDKKNFIKRYLNEARYAFQSMKYWIKVKDADVIYLQSNPTILYQMIFLKLFKRIPIIYSIYDIFPGHAFDIGVIRNRLIYDILRIMQKPCYRLATRITVLGPDMKNKVIEEGARADSVVVIPAWYDVKTTREIPREENRFIKKYSIPGDKFYVQFAGTVGYVFNYLTVIELAKRLINERDVVIQIVGDGNIKQFFVSETERLKLTNIQFYPLQPVEIVPDVYSACNVCLIPLQKGVIGNGVPSKAPILMACNRPIISSVEIKSDYAIMFKKYDMGIAVDIKDYDGLASAVRFMRDNPDAVQKMTVNAHDYCVTHYSSTQSTLQIIKICRDCVNNSKKKLEQREN